MRTTRTGFAIAVMVALITLHLPGLAEAQIKIVALGASNTYGKTVSRGEAYPAHLQSLLKGKGVNASVTNAGINGDTTGGMLARLSSAVPAGTAVVILQPGGNDKRRGQGGSTEANVETIRSRLAASGVKVVMMPNSMFGAVPQSERHPDGQHFTARGYAILAANILPAVMGAIGR